MLEVPGLEERGGAIAFTRTLTLTGNDQSLSVLVAERKGSVAKVEDGVGSLGNAKDFLAAAVVGGGRLIADGQRLVLMIPPGTSLVKLILGARYADGPRRFKPPLHWVPTTHGCPPTVQRGPGHGARR